MHYFNIINWSQTVKSIFFKSFSKKSHSYQCNWNLKPGKISDSLIHKHSAIFLLSSERRESMQWTRDTGIEWGECLWHQREAKKKGCWYLWTTCDRNLHRFVLDESVSSFCEFHSRKEKEKKRVIFALPNGLKAVRVTSRGERCFVPFIFYKKENPFSHFPLSCLTFFV